MYKTGGFERLIATHYHPMGSELEIHSQNIIDDLQKNPVCTITQAISRIKDLTGIERKPTQVRHFLRRHAFGYRKLSSIPGKVNPEKQKLRLDLSLNPAIDKARKGKVELLFCDAAHFTLSCFLCMIWSIGRIFLKTSHGRNRINVLGVVNALTKEVTTHINTTYITAETVVCFMKGLRGKYGLSLLS